MFKKLSFTFIVLLILQTSCSVIKQGQALQNLTHCKFSIQELRIKSLGGIPWTDIQDPSDIDADQYLQLLKGIFSNDINSVVEVKVHVFNPTDKRAYAEGAEWLLYVKDEQLADGMVNHPIEVASGESTTFNTAINFNILRIVKSKSLPEILSMLIQGNNQIDWSKFDLKLKLKPWYKSGETVKKYPGYIVLKP